MPAKAMEEWPEGNDRRPSLTSGASSRLSRVSLYREE
jgi:hypothetical protein